MRARVDIVGRRRRIQDGDQAEAIDRGCRRHFIETYDPKFCIQQCLDQLKIANTLQVLFSSLMHEKLDVRNKPMDETTKVIERNTSIRNDPRP